MFWFRRSILVWVVLGTLGCDPSFRTVVRANSIDQKRCRDSQLIIEYLDHNGTYGEESRFTEKRSLLVRDDLIEIYGGSISVPPDWVLLKIRCPTNGEVLFDSGRVTWKDGFYEAGFLRYFFYLDGPPKDK